MLAEGSPAMLRTYMRCPGFLAKILVKEPGCSTEARFIPGDPSANIGPQDDSIEGSLPGENAIRVETDECYLPIPTYSNPNDRIRTASRMFFVSTINGRFSDRLMRS